MSEDTVYKKQGRRGRPLGFKLSSETKEKIRQKRIGTYHTEETKEKISRSLSDYFKRKDLFTDTLEYDYRFSSNEIYSWIGNHSGCINLCDDVLTNKRIVYLSYIEQSFGDDIERLFSHNMTPEFILLLKEDMISRGLINEIEFIDSVL